MRLPRIILLASLCFCLVVTTKRLEAKGDDRPNMVIILADDMGYSDAGCYGGEIETPHLDWLAKRGARFRDFYNCSRCCPTRASLLTGAYPHRVGLAGNGATMAREAVTVAERLQQADYATAMIGKWHLSKLVETISDQDRISWMNHQVDLRIPFADPASYPTYRGFDRYYGVIWGVADYFDPFSLTRGVEPVREVADDYYITDDFTDHSVQTINDFAKTDRPFFLYVAYTAPHWPLHARPEDIIKYRGKYDSGWDALRQDRFQRQVALGLFDAQTPLGDVVTGKSTWAELSDEQRAYQAAKMEIHAAMVDRLDQGIGRIVEALRQTGQLDNTLLMFLSDNGASNELPGGAGYDRNGETRDGRKSLRDKALQEPGNRRLLGSAESYTGIGRAWASAANTPLRYWKKESFEGGCRTPLVVHWPAGLKTNQGELLHDLGHVMDIAPTCLAVAGVEPTDEFQMDGKSLLPILEGRSRAGHEALFFAHSQGKGMRQGDWKIAALSRDNWELFNLQFDPGETNDLAAEMPDRLEAMVSAWREWHHRINPQK